VMRGHVLDDVSFDNADAPAPSRTLELNDLHGDSPCADRIRFREFCRAARSTIVLVDGRGDRWSGFNRREFDQ
jgi:hypothetical protein